RLLGRHDAGDARSRQNVAFWRGSFGHGREGCGRKDDHGFGGRFAWRRFLARNVDHAGRAVFVEMGEVAHPGILAPISRRVAAATSASRIRLSPTSIVVTPAF